MANDPVVETPTILYPVMVDIQIMVQDERYGDDLIDALVQADAKGDIRMGAAARMDVDTYLQAKQALAQVNKELQEAVLNWVLAHRHRIETGVHPHVHPPEDNDLYEKWLAFVAATKGA